MANYYNPYYPTQNNAFPTNLNVGSTQPTQIQNGGFVSLPSEEMVYSYPVAMGNCVTFKIEGKPIVMEKSMSFSQFEAPKIKRFRLVEEETASGNESYDTNGMTDIDKVKSDIKDIWDKIDELENSKKNTPKRENKSGEG